jgi:hypothetical protein
LSILPFSHALFDTLLASVPEDERRRSMHVVSRRGRVRSAGDAVIALMAVSPRTRPRAWLVRAVPSLRRKVAAQYEKTAARRGELSERVPDAPVTVVEPRWVRLPR